MIQSVATGIQWSRPMKSSGDRFLLSAPLVSRSNWSDHTTESESGSGPFSLKLFPSTNFYVNEPLINTHTHTHTHTHTLKTLTPSILSLSLSFLKSFPSHFHVNDPLTKEYSEFKTPYSDTLPSVLQYKWVLYHPRPILFQKPLLIDIYVGPNPRVQMSLRWNHFP